MALNHEAIQEAKIGVNLMHQGECGDHCRMNEYRSANHLAWSTWNEVKVLSWEVAWIKGEVEMLSISPKLHQAERERYDARI